MRIVCQGFFPCPVPHVRHRHQAKKIGLRDFNLKHRGTETQRGSNSPRLLSQILYESNYKF